MTLEDKTSEAEEDNELTPAEQREIKFHSHIKSNKLLKTICSAEYGFFSGCDFVGLIAGRYDKKHKYLGYGFFELYIKHLSERDKKWGSKEDIAFALGAGLGGFVNAAGMFIPAALCIATDAGANLFLSFYKGNKSKTSTD